MRSEGYTLWLLPTGSANKKFLDLIKKLARENNAPVFTPHVTLLGELMQTEEECIKLTEKLVQKQKPFIINMEQIDYEDYHFRTLFVKAIKTKQLLDLHERAKELFRMQNIPPYMPHLSILYGTFPSALKEQIIKEIGKDQSAEFEIKSIHLIKGGEVEDWKIVGEFPLSN